jgi:hypothetical protein
LEEGDEGLSLPETPDLVLRGPLDLSDEVGVAVDISDDRCTSFLVGRVECCRLLTGPLFDEHVDVCLGEPANRVRNEGDAPFAGGRLFGNAHLHAERSVRAPNVAPALKRPGTMLRSGYG